MNNSQNLFDEIYQDNLYSDFKLSGKENLLLQFIYWGIRLIKLFVKRKLPVPKIESKVLLKTPLPNCSEEGEFYSQNGYLLQKSLQVPDFLIESIKKDTSIILNNYRDMGSFPYIHLLNKNVLALGSHASLMNVLKKIFRVEQISLIRSTIHAKKEEDNFYTPWHFDVVENTVTVWIAITEADENNGCLQIIPRSFVLNDDSIAEYFATFKSVHQFNLKNE
ncbi:MAG: phytanoyl-CoA dioxygenase family protein [Trichodesmium sp. MO_231.B1]|nr:phytanoyl-CoA dioxygenase family protein [Trichodesmium sp. MO_231.B1]